MKHKIALSGSYTGGNTEKLFENLSRDEILQLSLIGREITLRVRSDNLDEVRKALQSQGIGNISIIEWKKEGITVGNSGTGSDVGDIINISVIPSVLGEGLHQLAFMHESSMKNVVTKKIEEKVEGILAKAGITDVIYIVQVKRKEREEQYLKAAEDATLRALFEAGGIVTVEQ